MTDLTLVYATRIRAMRKQLQAHPLKFRADARAAMAVFTRQDRRLARLLNTGGVSAYVFLQQWRDDHAPTLDHIEKAAHSTALRKQLADELLLEKADTHQYAEQLVRRRLGEVQQVFIDRHYGGGTQKEQLSVHAFLSRPREAITSFFDRYVSFELYRKLCQQENISIYDQQRAWVHRLYQWRRDMRAVTRLRRQTRKEIERLRNERSDVEHSHGGIVARMFSLNIDLVTVLATRQEYTKALEKLPKKSRTLAAKRLEVYEKRTKAIRTQYVDALPETAALTEVQALIKEIDAVILAVFDMGATARNSLMAQFKRYRELTQQIKQCEALIEE